MADTSRRPAPPWLQPGLAVGGPRRSSAGAAEEPLRRTGPLLGFAVLGRATALAAMAMPKRILVDAGRDGLEGARGAGWSGLWSASIRRMLNPANRVPGGGGGARIRRIEDLLTERSTLAIPRLCHNAKADLLRKQQVLGSNPSVGSTPPVRAQEVQLSGGSTVLAGRRARSKTC